MADNIPITSGTGTNVATDDVSSVHYQRIKVVTSLDGQAADGLSVDRRTSLSNTATAVKAAAGQVYGYHIQNPNTSDVWLHFYNVASGSTTPGTTTPTFSLWIPGGGGVDSYLTIPITFTTAITVAATTTATGGTAPSSGLVTNILYV